MKIEKVETLPFTDEFLSQLFVRITTEDGLTGTGEAWYGLPIEPVASAINDALAPQILGEDSTRIEHIWQKMYKYGYRYGTEGILMCGLSGIDLALWDLLGKRLGVPVALLLGGRVRDSLKAYASFPPYRREEWVRREVERAVELGFAGVKLHEYDVKLAAAARDTAPDDYPIMVDVNGRFTPIEAEETARQLADLGVYWFEEPIWPMQDYEAMARLRQRVDLKLAAGENEYALKAFERLMSTGAVDFVQPEITKIGGISVARKVSALAELYNVAICPHSFRTGPAAYANIHWAFTQMNMEWLEIPFLPAGRSLPSNTPDLKLIGGEIQFPDGPGFGVPSL